MVTGGYVYIMTNLTHTVLYTGVTSKLLTRVEQHRAKESLTSFTARYNVVKLVYYEGYHRIEYAIAEEKRIKGLSRAKKFAMINAMNPEWIDLFDTAEAWR